MSGARRSGESERQPLELTGHGEMVRMPNVASWCQEGGLVLHPEHQIQRVSPRNGEEKVGLKVERRRDSVNKNNRKCIQKKN